VTEFRLADVSRSPAFFDVKKLTHLNGEYIRELSNDEFVARCAPWVDPDVAQWRPGSGAPIWTSDRYEPSVFASIAPLVQERVNTLGDVPGMIDFLFLDIPLMDATAFDKSIRNDPLGPTVLGRVSAVYASVEWSSDALHAATLAIGDELSLNLRKTQAPIRCAVTGRLVGPPLFESLALLGREVTLARIEGALSMVES
jgi:glutamyl-tRNA synthetase